jgi:hypothetical protein
MLFVYLPDKQPTGFISGASGDFHQAGVGPKSLSCLKVNAVFALVLGALVRVVFETHDVFPTRRLVYLRYSYYTVGRRLRQLRGVRLDQRGLPFRHLSMSIALKQEFSTVFVTVNPARRDKNPFSFRHLSVPETIEWE